MFPVPMLYTLLRNIAIYSSTFPKYNEHLLRRGGKNNEETSMHISSFLFYTMSSDREIELNENCPDTNAD